jgi:hypothetical protein
MSIVNQCTLCTKINTTGKLLQVCSRCKSVRYCNAACQRGHWKSHKKECKDLAKLFENGTDTDITTINKAKFNANNPTEKHKMVFDQIVKKYKLDSDERAGDIADLLTSGKPVNPKQFASKYGMEEGEALAFLEWIKVGVTFKEETIDTNAQAAKAMSQKMRREAASKSKGDGKK